MHIIVASTKLQPLSNSGRTEQYKNLNVSAANSCARMVYGKVNDQVSLKDSESVGNENINDPIERINFNGSNNFDCNSFIIIVYRGLI